MGYMDIEKIKLLNIDFSKLTDEFREKHKLTDGEMLYISRNISDTIILKTYRDIWLNDFKK